MFFDGIVQAPVLLSHGGPIVVRDIVEPHRDFDEHPVQRQQNVQHVLGVALD